MLSVLSQALGVEFITFMSRLDLALFICIFYCCLLCSQSQHADVGAGKAPNPSIDLREYSNIKYSAPTNIVNIPSKDFEDEGKIAVVNEDDITISDGDGALSNEKNIKMKTNKRPCKTTHGVECDKQRSDQNDNIIKNAMNDPEKNVQVGSDTIDRTGIICIAAAAVATVIAVVSFAVSIAVVLRDKRMMAAKWPGNVEMGNCSGQPDATSSSMQPILQNQEISAKCSI